MKKLPEILLSRELSALLYFFPLLALSGSLAYLLIGLYWPVRLLLFLMSLGGSWWLAGRFPMQPADSQATARWQKREVWTTIAYFVCLIAGLAILLDGRSNRPLISPWDTVSNFEFLAFGLGSLCLLLLNRWRPLPRVLLCGHYLWSFSVFIIVYAIGYGFDPFIHEASIRAIESSGRIAPLTPYYLGQYSLVSIFHGLFAGNLSRWSQLLVPGLAALLLPLLWPRRSTGLIMLAFSFAIFTLTTPQNLAYVFLAAVILLATRPQPDKGTLTLAWLLAGAALFTQPIAGIPAVLLAASLSAESRTPRRAQSLVRWAFLAAYALAVPLAFYFFSASAGASVNLAWPDMRELFAGLIPSNPQRERWWLNFTYLFAANRGWLFAALSVGGIVALWRQQEHLLLRRLAWPAGALVISALVASLLNFHFLIEYERFDYPLRLLVIAALFMLPLAARPLDSFLDRLAQQPLRLGWPLYLLLGAVLAVSLYLSYPRFDHYHNSHGYAVSRADVMAVDWIENDAAGADYIVLANQQVSAAALRQLGFKKYYPGDVFFYPIPTGGPLYQEYLNMTGRPTTATMSAAMDLAGVRLAYFVLDDYWFEADKIGPEAELIADHSELIADGQVRVYRFRK